MLRPSEVTKCFDIIADVTAGLAAADEEDEEPPSPTTAKEEEEAEAKTPQAAWLPFLEALLEPPPIPVDELARPPARAPRNTATRLRPVCSQRREVQRGHRTG